MTKDVLVSISGMHMDVVSGMTNPDNEPIEVVTPASYYLSLIHISEPTRP